MGKNLTKQFGNISIVDCLCCWQKYACVELIYTYVMFVKCTFQFFSFILPYLRLNEKDCFIAGSLNIILCF
jgi:hypothetical protein